MTTYRVGLVGAGHISEFHLVALKRLRNVKVQGLADLDQERAKLLAGRFGVAAATSLEDLLERGVDVIHVLTPPESHAPIALQALRAGCHVLVEKPGATDLADLEAMAELAESKGLSLGVCHSLLFDPQVRRALLDVKAGRLGRLVSVDILRSSVYPPYAGGPLPAHYRQAGFPFRDLGIHCLYIIEAFLGPIENVSASWRSLGGDRNLAFDEWRAVVNCAGGIGQFQLSWNVHPLQNQIILQGTKGVRRVDLFLMSQAHRAALPLPRPAERLVNALTDSLQPLVGVPWNVARLAAGGLRPYQGVRAFVDAFYVALRAGSPPPVTARDALPTVRWTEEIARAAERDFDSRLAKHPVRRESKPILVTGASGGVGQALLHGLREQGLGPIRVLVRRTPAWSVDGLEVAVGNLGDPRAVDEAVRNARWVFHLGATMNGSASDHQCGTVQGTRNVVAACLRHGVEKLIHVSSLSVLQWAGAPDGAPLTEEGALEPRPGERGAYTQAKLEAERLVAAAAREGLSAVIVRPGQIFGRGIPLLTPAIARRFARYYVVLGDGELTLPLVYIDDVVDGLLAAAHAPLSGGEVMHLVDDNGVTQNRVLAELCGDGARLVRVPRSLVFATARLLEIPFGLVGRSSPLPYYRLRSALAFRTFPHQRATESLAWSPRIGVRQGVSLAASLCRPASSRK